MSSPLRRVVVRAWELRPDMVSVAVLTGLSAVGPVLFGWTWWPILVGIAAAVAGLVVWTAAVEIRREDAALSERDEPPEDEP